MNKQLNETHKLNDTVIMSYPSLKGVVGTIGEIRYGLYKGTPKTYTIDYQHPKHSAQHKSSIQLSSSQFKAHKKGTLGEEIESVDELSIDTIKSYKDKVATNPPPSKTTSDILHKAIRRFAGKERAEDRIHHDEMVKMRERLGIKEETDNDANVTEVSNELLGRYKKKAGEYASAADKVSDIMHRAGNHDAANRLTKRANKKFSGIIKATIKQFDNDRKRVSEDNTVDEENIDEKHLTPAELKKREEIAKAMERKYPGMNMGKKMAIATSIAKRVVEEANLDETKKTPEKYEVKFTPSTGNFHIHDIKTGKRIATNVANNRIKAYEVLDKYNKGISEEVLDEAAVPSHKVGDTVWVTSPTNKATTITGKVTKIGPTLTTVKHKDGSEANYPHKLVNTDYEVLHSNPAKTYKQFQREHLEQTGKLLTLSEVKYIIENENGGAGVIAQHAGVDGHAPQNTGKVKKMMGNKSSTDVIVKIITKDVKSN